MIPMGIFTVAKDKICTEVDGNNILERAIISNEVHEM